MQAHETILQQAAGAAFFRADLHIHSFGGSHDVSDITMTPEEIVITAAGEGLSLISITDHNEISNIERAIVAGTNASVTVIPGIELSTPQGHLLCYFKTLTSIRRFHGQLSIIDSGMQNSRCQQSILECLNFAKALDGFCILAHIDSSGGYEQEVPGFSPHKADVLCHPALLGIEIKNATSGIAFSPADVDPNRARLGEERINRLQLGSRQYLARVLNSDAHSLIALGHNAQNAKKVTRYKMDELSFDGLRIALEDSDARVRIEDLVPQSIPRIVGIHLDGGFLNNQTIRFSPNLNCIIGGRGTGKSTMFEAARCLIEDAEKKNTVVDSEVWPEELHLIWCDKAGQNHNLFRLKNSEIQNLDSPETGPTNFAIDCFGQGDAAKISAQAQSDPLALLHYLDRFAQVGPALAEEVIVRDKLLNLQSEIEAAVLNVQQIPQHERALATTQRQLAALQKAEVKDLIILQRQLATERQVRSQIGDFLSTAKRESTALPSHKAVVGIRNLIDPAMLTVGGPEFQTILNGATVLESTVTAAEADIKSGLSDFDQIVTTQINQWKAKEAEAQKKIDEKRRELEALKVVFDMSYIAKLAQDEANQQQNVTNLKLWVPHLANLKKSRLAVLAERWRIRDKVAAIRDAFGRKASATLKAALSDLNVSLKYTASAYSVEAIAIIIDAMGWRTNQQQRASWLVRDLRIPELLTAIAKQNVNAIIQIKTPEGVSIFEQAEANLIIEKLAVPSIQYQLERVVLHDLPRLQVTKRITEPDGRVRFATRDFSRLSLGQQQSVLLALMLSAESDRPLIIDQPEDNLDG